MALMTIWLTLNELADYLKKGQSTLYRLARAGQIPAQKFGRNWRFDRDEIDAWIKSGMASRLTQKEETK